MVAVRADDAIAEEGTAAFLQRVPQLAVVPAEPVPWADVLLVVADEVTEDTLWLMRRMSGEAPNKGMRIVLVASAISEPQLVRAVGYGLVGVVLRPYATFSHVVRAITTARAGHAPIPSSMVRTLVDEMRVMRQEASGGGTRPLFDAREIDVLTLLAEGCSTAEIAVRLSYSERTVKNIIHGLVSRSGMRNRTHAVAYALTSGLI
ncbi:response regulator transcription factor [Streptacidiphilus sp. ASG 303]|uniref:helix-turn-helix transcriptional regulator n=1 Tax=Streptacidiphilus sp. ASG 303 TaxID=2896847 RepID=UPI0027DF14C4|nr:response regulator transcription factor [Streptacidiphilus sp. ASG 303]